MIKVARAAKQRWCSACGPQIKTGERWTITLLPSGLSGSLAQHNKQITLCCYCREELRAEMEKIE